MSLCFQSWIRLRLAFLVICFPCCVLCLVPILIIFHAHDMNMTWLWCKIMLKTNVEQTKRNEGSYFYLYPFEDLI